MAYSPILITVYNRYYHLKQCIESLLSCPEAKHSTLYIAIDAPASPEDAPAVTKVQNYVESIRGFQNIIIIKRDSNIGAEKNSQLATTQVFGNHDTIIRLEDDVIVGKGFLNFINQGLRDYKHHPSVVGVCGYLPPGIKHPYGKPFFLNRIAPYGWGRWKKKEVKLTSKMNPQTIRSYFTSFRFFREYEGHSPHSARAIPLLINGDMMPKDIATGIIMQANNWTALYPPESITKTIGNDGSGLHSGFNKSLQNQEISDEIFNIPKNLPVTVDIEAAEKVAAYRRAPGIKYLNYLIFLSITYLPTTYRLYTLARNVVSRIRK